jgi:hypothetical protein
MARFPDTEPEIAALAALVVEGLERGAEDFPTPPVPATAHHEATARACQTWGKGREAWGKTRNACGKNRPVARGCARGGEQRRLARAATAQTGVPSLLCAAL